MTETAPQPCSEGGKLRGSTQITTHRRDRKDGNCLTRHDVGQESTLHQTRVRQGDPERESEERAEGEGRTTAPLSR